jgi:hypothetical protein
MNDRNWGGKREGAGRKKGDIVYKTFSVVLPAAEAELLKEFARREKLTVSRFISKAIGLDVMAKGRKERAEEINREQSSEGC